MRATLDDNQSATQISAAEKAAFLGDTRDRADDAAALTLTQIMSQKYIAQWAWGHNELWMDMRRYHYTDIDPATGQQIYPGLRAADTNLYPDNDGKLVQRIRPRYNSEYVWNIAALRRSAATRARLSHEAALDHSTVTEHNHMTNRFTAFACSLLWRCGRPCGVRQERRSEHHRAGRRRHT